MNQETDTARPEPVFHSDDVEAVAGYRSLSALAVIGFMLGFLSVLSLIWPLLVVLPIVGTVISIVALRRIATSEGLLAGWWLAAAGLALCIMFGIAGLSRDMAVRYVRTQRAEQFALEWIELVASGETDRAFRLTADAMRPPPPPEPGAPEPTKAPIEAFAEQPLVAGLTNLGPNARTELVETLAYQELPGRQFEVRQHYRVSPPAAPPDASGEPVELALRLRHGRFGRDRASQWVVLRIETPEAAAASHP